MEAASISIFDRTYQVYGYPEDGWFQALRQRGAYDFEFDLNILREFVKEDSICLDIGANIGVLSLAMAALAPKGRIYSFEASKKAADACKKTCAPYDNITVEEAIIGQDGDAVTWVEDSRELSSSHYISCGNSRTISIDSLNLPRVDFIKMDVEGAEIDVLNGAASLLDRCKPPVIMEFNTFALVHYRNIMPRQALKQIREHFSQINVQTKRGARRLSLPPSEDEAFLRYNFLNGLVDDLICRKEAA